MNRSRQSAGRGPVVISAVAAATLSVTMWAQGTNAVPGTAGGTDRTREEQMEFGRLVQLDWKEELSDSCTANWRDNWTLDGSVGTVENTKAGMELVAGPEFRNDAHHMVLWTRQSFDGDVKIDYEYTRLDSEVRCVNILYVQATGSGVDDYSEDISAWARLRSVPAMRMYFNHMNTYHISYAAYPNTLDTTEDYIRARRYMPKRKGLAGTGLKPDYGRTELFKEGVPHRITVIKQGRDLYMHIRNAEREMLCHWRNDALPPIESGRIGLRHMFTRSARYRDFRVSTRAPAALPDTGRLTTEIAAGLAPRGRIFSERQRTGLRKLLENPYPQEVPAWCCENTALATLGLNERLEEGNAAILEVAREHFDQLVTDDTGAVHGEFHWHAYLLARVYFLFNQESPHFPGRLAPEAQDAILDMFWRWTHQICRLDMVDRQRDWWVWGSENHHIQLWGSLWACLDILAQRPGYRQRVLPDGTSVRDASLAFTEYFKRFMANRAARGLFIEVNSPTYTKYSLSPIYNMADFASDSELARLTTSFLDLFWAQWAVEQIDGIRGGSRHRCYPGRASQQTAGGGDGFSWYHFGLGTPRSIHPGHVTAATTFYQPHRLIAELATNPGKRGTYEVVNRPVGRWSIPVDEREANQYAGGSTGPLHQIQGIYSAAPDKAGIRRYLYCTPEFILGSSMVPALALEEWLAISSQNRWDWLTLAGNPHARIAVQCEEPARGSVYNTHWSVQNRGVAVIQRLRRPHQKGAKGNRLWFDGSLVLTEADDCVFAESPAAYAAVRVVDGGVRWEPALDEKQTTGRWLICADAFTPVVIEAAGKSRFSSLEEFRQAVMAAEQRLDGATYTYTSRVYDTTLALCTDYSRSPEIDGQPVDYRPAMAIDSPFLRIPYGGTTAELTGLGGEQVRYDFSGVGGP